MRTHAIRHDRAKEHGAYATPHGRPRKPRQDAPNGAAVKVLPLRARPEGRALTPAPYTGASRTDAGNDLATTTTADL